METTTELQLGLPLYIKGKVRDVYDLGDKLLLVASDRISAYDVVLPTPVPDKGKILNQLSDFWFGQTRDIVPNHRIAADVDAFPAELKKHKGLLSGRSMLVWKTEKFPVECVVRGYLSGSGWKEYKAGQNVCGVPLPAGLQESSRLPEPIFTPATKEEGGKHDENITFERLCSIVGRPSAERLRETSIAIFKAASRLADAKDLVLADTKFEFGLKTVGGKKEITLIDECLTPDSSRYWEKSHYAVGTSPHSFDKQFVRDYLDGLKWDRQPPAPPLPEDVVRKTREKYLEAFTRLTGRPLSA